MCVCVCGGGGGGGGGEGGCCLRDKIQIINFAQTNFKGPDIIQDVQSTQISTNRFTRRLVPFNLIITQQ